MEERIPCDSSGVRSVERITPYDAGKSLETLKQELGLDELIRLSANESPLGPSPAVVEAIRREAARAHLYPDGGASAVRAALSDRLGVPPTQIVIGNGADELIGMIARAAFDPGDEVVVPTPSFEPYGTSATLAGARVAPSPLAGYETDLDDMQRAGHPADQGGDPLHAAQPGLDHHPARAADEFLDALRPDPPLVILDEAYCDFCDDPEYPNGVELLAQHPRLIPLRTFSKIAGLAGLRVGYAIGSPESIDRLNRVARALQREPARPGRRRWPRWTTRSTGSARGT